MVELRTVAESDLEAFRRFHNRYVDRDEPLETVREWYHERPALLLGAYEGDELVGHCLGRPRGDDTVELSGIGVAPSRRRRGIGSALLSAFEDRAASLGFRRVELGSAGDGVDEFYLEHGYSPVSVLVRYGSDEVPPDYREQGYAICDERTDGDTRKVYVAVDAFGSPSVEEVRRAFDDPDAIYIMAKAIGSA